MEAEPQEEAKNDQRADWSQFMCEPQKRPRTEVEIDEYGGEQHLKDRIKKQEDKIRVLKDDKKDLKRKIKSLEDNVLKPK